MYNICVCILLLPRITVISFETRPNYGKYKVYYILFSHLCYLNTHFNFSQQAERSIRFYRQIGDKADEYEALQSEISKLKSTFSKNEVHAGLKWTDFASKESRKALTIGVVLAVLNRKRYFLYLNCIL